MKLEDNTYHNPYIINAFVTSTCLLMGKNILIVGSSILNALNSRLNLLVLLISVVLYGYALFRDRFRLYVVPKQYTVIAFILLFWIVTYVFNSAAFSMSYVREEIVFFLKYSFPALIILPYAESCTSILEGFYKKRWLLLACCVFTVVSILLTGQIQGVGSRYAVYSLSFGRALIMPCLLFLSAWFRSYKVYDLLISIFIFGSIFLFGSRFPILCIGFYIVWKICGLVKLKKSVIGMALLSIAIIFCYLLLDNIIYTLNIFLQGLGINSRALSLLLNGNFSYDSNRFEMYEAIIQLVNKSPICGYGAFGGNYILNNGLSHSFVFDVFANLGYVFGGIFLVICGIAIINLFLHEKNEDNREFFLICLAQFLPICIIQLSLWRATHFWYLIAFCIGRLRQEKGN